MTILTRTGGVAMTNCFLVADEAAGKAVLFDAPDHTTATLLAEVRDRGWELAGLWLTHGHFDHFADHVEVRRQFPDVPILLHELEEPKARRPDLQTRIFGLPFEIAPLTCNQRVSDGQLLRIGNIEVRVLHTPGHAPGHVAYHLPGEQVLVGGDLIIGGSVGRTDLPDSEPERLLESIRKVMALPDPTQLLGGHGPATTLGHERMANFFVQEALALG